MSYKLLLVLLANIILYTSYLLGFVKKKKGREQVILGENIFCPMGCGIDMSLCTKCVHQFFLAVQCNEHISYNTYIGSQQSACEFFQKNRNLARSVPEQLKYLWENYIEQIKQKKFLLQKEIVSPLKATRKDALLVD